MCLFHCLEFHQLHSDLLLMVLIDRVRKNRATLNQRCSCSTVILCAAEFWIKVLPMQRHILEYLHTVHISGSVFQSVPLKEGLKNVAIGITPVA